MAPVAQNSSCQWAARHGDACAAQVNAWQTVRYLISQPQRRVLGWEVGGLHTDPYGGGEHAQKCAQDTRQG